MNLCIKCIRYEHGSMVKNIYSVAMCEKINFNKIEQGFVYIMSNLVVMKQARLWIPGMIISGGKL